MNAALIFVAATAIGIDVGWEQIPDGGVEYIIQVQPQVLERLQEGKVLVSELPAGLDIRRYRITVGTEKLPREPSLSQLREDLRQEQLAREQQELEQRKHEQEQRDELVRDRAELAREREQLEKARAALGPTDSTDPEVEAPEEKMANRPQIEADEQVPGEVSPPEAFKTPPDAKKVKYNADAGTPAGKLQHDSSQPSPGDKNETSQPSEQSKPWAPLFFTVVLLIASVSGNVYLGLLAWGERNRCRGLLHKLHLAAGSS